MRRLSVVTPGVAVTARSSERFASMVVADLFAHKLLQAYDRALVVPLDRLDAGVARWIVAVLHAPSYAARYERMLRTSLPRIPRPPGGALQDEMIGLAEQVIAVDTGAARLEPAPIDEARSYAIGSHRVIESWLRRRKDREPSAEERRDLAYAAAAARERDRLGRALDAAIEEGGGWGALRT
jgi:hypothetical protein